MRLGPRSSWSFSRLVWLSFVLPVLSAAQPSQVEVPDGTTLTIKIQQTIRSDRARQGDVVRAKLLAPLLENGRVIVPAKAVVEGKVLAAGSLGSDRPSRILIRFERATWKKGRARLNAYPTGYVIRKQAYSYRSRVECPLLLNTPTSYDEYCRSAAATAPDTTQMFFDSPVIQGLKRRELDALPGAIVLESTKTNITLSKGMIWRIRHTATSVAAGRMPSE